MHNVQDGCKLFVFVLVGYLCVEEKWAILSHLFYLVFLYLFFYYFCIFINNQDKQHKMLKK